jgi:hypothetical protein
MSMDSRQYRSISSLRYLSSSYTSPAVHHWRYIISRAHQAVHQVTQSTTSTLTTTAAAAHATTGALLAFPLPSKLP